MQKSKQYKIELISRDYEKWEYLIEVVANIRFSGSNWNWVRGCAKSENQNITAQQKTNHSIQQVSVYTEN